MKISYAGAYELQLRKLVYSYPEYRKIIGSK